MIEKIREKKTILAIFIVKQSNILKNNLSRTYWSCVKY